MTVGDQFTSLLRRVSSRGIGIVIAIRGHLRRYRLREPNANVIGPLYNSTERALSADEMYIVAHPDDSLLFQSPSLLRSLQAKANVCTVHIAAGDNGRGAEYWKRREFGIEAAYAHMVGAENQWEHFSLAVGNQQVALSKLETNSNVVVLFMRLPDGGYPLGKGSPKYGFQSLSKLWRRPRATITAVDGSASYSRQGLIDTVALIMNMFTPRLIAVQDYVNDFIDGDHMDHYAAARFSRAAHESCSFPHQFVGYAGYRVASLPSNVSGKILEDKQNAFYTYGQFDEMACSSESTCSSTPYAAWLEREYIIGSETVAQ